MAVYKPWTGGELVAKTRNELISRYEHLLCWLYAMTGTAAGIAIGAGLAIWSRSLR